LRPYLACLALIISTTSAAGGMGRPLVVCADPNNLPFSNRARAGFENKIIEQVAKDLGTSVTYVWWAQRRGYVRNTLNDAKCDVWPGMATGVDVAATTRPYYRSTYVFVTRQDVHLAHLTLDDPRLKSASIGVQMIGNDSMNTPPAHAIASRGIVDNVRGYMVYGDSSQPGTTPAIIDAVAHRQIEVALVWGPLAGYFAHRSPTPLRIEAVTPANDARWPMAFDMSMGVKRNNRELLDRIDASLDHERPTILHILEAYQVPLDTVPERASSPR
jgi:mxaJ protein